MFTEFLEMVEKTFSYEMADKIIDTKKLKSKGVYTAGDNYDADELRILAGKLAEKTGLKEEEIYRMFGEYLFQSFKTKVPEVFTESVDILNFLGNLRIFFQRDLVNVYPDAKVPDFIVKKQSSKEVIITYISERNMPHLAEGLLKKSIEFFKQPIEIRMISQSNGSADFSLNFL